MDTTMDESYVVVTTIGLFVVLLQYVENPTEKFHSSNQVGLKSNQPILDRQEWMYNKNSNFFCATFLPPLLKGNQCPLVKEGG
jgi:hypothetical protein